MPSHELTAARAAATGMFLLALYWLTASGAFHSIDEHAVFAVGRNIVLFGEVDQSTLYWGEPYLGQARIGRDGELYSKYGIGHSLLVALPIALARWLPGAGLASSAMMLNSLATAVTASLLVLCARQWGYSSRTAITAALLFGAATFAWVYARTMFSEPLVALGWLAAVWLLAGGAQGWRLVLAGVLLALTVAIRPASVLVIPLFALPLLDSESPRRSLRRTIMLGLPVLSVAAGLLLFNQVRFGDALDFGYSESFNGSLVEGLAGFLFSADRSLFLFAPPLLALPWGIIPFIRRHGAWGWTLLVLSLASLLLYSQWPVFWGGPVWGPRYLLPVLPLLMLLLLPVLERAWTQGWARAGLACVTLAGVGMQLPGVIWNLLPLTQELGQRYPLWMVPPRVEWLDIAWLYGVPQGIVLSLAMALAAVAFLRAPRWRWAALSSSVTILGSLVLLVWLGQSELGYRTDPAYAAVLDRLVEQGRAGDALVLNPAPFQEPFEPLLWFMNSPRLPVPLHGIYREPPGGEVSAQRLERLLKKHERLWLLTRGTVPGDPDSTAEQWLVEGAHPRSTEWLDNDFRLTLFERPRPPVKTGRSGALLGNTVALHRWAVAYPGATERGVQVMLEWQTLQPVPASFHTFAQLLDSEGRMVAGWDSVPRAAFAPTIEWSPGKAVEERLVVELPPESESGDFKLIVGLYDPATGERLRTPDGADAILLTSIVLGEASGGE